jgi:tetratricopeptide (TPR) repeat protein
MAKDHCADRIGFYASLALLACLCTVLQHAQAQTTESVRLYEEGNRYYVLGEYEQARDAYEASVRTGYASGMLYYNLGNVYYRQDKIGPAVLNYEKARRLMPDDVRIQHNLQIVRSKIADQFTQVPEPYWQNWWQRIVRAIGINGLYIAGLALYLTAIVLIGYRILTSTRNPWHRRAVAGTLLLGALLLAMSYIASIEITNRREAVVLAEQVAVHQEPGPESLSELSIHEGVLLYVLNERDGWLQVRLPEGTIGWIDATTVAEV